MAFFLNDMVASSPPFSFPIKLNVFTTTTKLLFFLSWQLNQTSFNINMHYERVKKKEKRGLTSGKKKSNI